MNSVRELKAKFGLNLLGYGYAQLVTIAVQLLLVPFFLSCWGADLYAEWLVLTSLPLLLVLADFGVSQVSASKATIAAGSENWAYVRVILQTAFVFSFFICLSLFLVCLILVGFFDFSGVLKLDVINNADAAIVFLLMMGCVCVNILCASIDAWYRAIDRTSLGAFLLANRRVVDIAVSIFVLMSARSPVCMAYLLFCGQILMLFICIFFAVKFSPIKIFGFSDASLNEFKSVVKPALAYMSFPVAQVITLQGGLQMLNQLADAKVVVLYSMSRTLVRLVLQIGVVANHALKPELSRLIGAGQIHTAKAFTARVSLVSMGIAVGAMSMLVFFGPEIIYYWSKGSVGADRVDIFFMGSHAVLHVMWIVPASLMIASNKHNAVAMCYAFVSLAGIFLWYLFSGFILPYFAACMLLLAPEVAALLYVSSGYVLGKR
ncbi:MAG: hypothetical protein CFE49_00325 [Pseudomonas sp. PGPPP3]|nr:MAG: hypothetical protein CFE49_00325 [Pseudomonas sp. PGPPP3]